MGLTALQRENAGFAATTIIGYLPFTFFQTISVNAVFDHDDAVVIPGAVLPL